MEVLSSVVFVFLVLHVSIEELRTCLFVYNVVMIMQSEYSSCLFSDRNMNGWWWRGQDGFIYIHVILIMNVLFLIYCIHSLLCWLISDKEKRVAFVSYLIDVGFFFLHISWILGVILQVSSHNLSIQPSLVAVCGVDTKCGIY